MRIPLFLFRRSSARYTTVRSAVRDQIREAAEEQGVEVDSESMTGEQTNRLFRIRYEWEIRPESDCYIVSEDQYLSSAWALLAVLVLLLFFSSIPVSFPEKLLVYVPIILLGGAIMRPLLYETPVEGTVDINETYRTLVAAPIMIGFILLSSVVTLVIAWMAITFTANLWPLTILFVFTIVASSLIYRHQSLLLRFEPQDVPHVYELITGHLVVILFGLIPISGLIAVHTLVESMPERRSLFYLMFAGIGLLVLGAMIRIVVRHRTLTYHEFLEGGETIRRPTRRVPVLLLLGASSWAMVAVSLFFLWTYPLLQEGFLDSVLLGIVALPVLYIPAGIVFQTFGFVVELGRLFRKSEPTTVGTPVGIEPQIREIDTDDYVAGSYSLVFRDYVFVSTALIEELEPDELGAILAHEEGHIKNGDAKLSFITPILSIVLLTGKNVIYAVLDFRKRELRADAYAAEKVGRDTFRNTLDRLSSSKNKRDTHEFGLESAPTFVSFSSVPRDNSIDRYFGTYFGNFGLVEAHPSFEERIENVEMSKEY